MAFRKSSSCLPPPQLVWTNSSFAIDNIMDGERREDTFGLLMSLNMLVKFGDAFNYTGFQFEQWATEAGSRKSKSAI